MNEQAERTPEQISAATNLLISGDQSSQVGASGLLMYEGAKKTFESGDAEALIDKADALSLSFDVQDGLEYTILGGGLQTLAQRYGADRFLQVIQDPQSITMGKVIESFAPDEKERAGLYEVIESEPIEDLVDQLNDTLGGVTGRLGGDEENIAISRHFDLQTIKAGKDTDASIKLLSGGLGKLIEQKPHLAEHFRETNDVVSLLKDIRDEYEPDFTEFSSELEKAKIEIDMLVDQGEAGVDEVEAISDDIFGDQIIRLEAKLATVTNEEARDIIKTMLDQKAAEVQLFRDDFAKKKEAIRSKVIGDLGAGRLYNLQLYAPVSPNLTNGYYKRHNTHKLAENSSGRTVFQPI
jgi:hypothetical protein